MTKPSLAILLFLLSVASTSWAKTKYPAGMSHKCKLQFDNSLSQCIAIKSHSTQQISNTRLFNLNYQYKQSIAGCGCKSTLAQYRTFTPHQELSAGLIDFREKKSLNLTLSNTDLLLTQTPVTVSFNCAQPL